MMTEQQILELIESRTNEILSWLNQRQQRDLSRNPERVNLELTAWALALGKCYDYTKFAMDDALLKEFEKIETMVKLQDGRSSMERHPERTMVN
jgi:hypothetical protein